MLDDIGWVLTSALYLDAKWATPFDPSRTGQAPFTTAGAQSVTATFMNGDDFPYAADGGWQAVSLPYRGGRLAMTALLPPAGSASCALPSMASLTMITRSLDGSRAGLADVSLPEVNLDTSGATGDVEPALGQLGMGAAFQQNADSLRAVAARLHRLRSAGGHAPGRPSRARSVRRRRRGRHHPLRRHRHPGGRQR